MLVLMEEDKLHQQSDADILFRTTSSNILTSKFSKLTLIHLFAKSISSFTTKEYAVVWSFLSIVIVIASFLAKLSWPGDGEENF